MSPHEIADKLKRGEALSSMEQALLDAYLEDPAQGRVVSLVKKLGLEEPSLAWRSRLNERLLSTGRRSAIWKILRLHPGFGPAVAGAVAGAVLLAVSFGPGRIEGHADGTVTADLLIQWHEEAAAATILPGDGTNLEGFSAQPARSDRNALDDLLYGDRLHAL